MPTDTEARAPTAEVERLAREVMGRERMEMRKVTIADLRSRGPAARLFWLYAGTVWCWDGDTEDEFPFEPFDDPKADFQVLERVRETWPADDSPDRFSTFVMQLGHASDYHVGDYARAALAVLDAEKTR